MNRLTTTTKLEEDFGDYDTSTEYQRRKKEYLRPFLNPDDYLPNARELHYQLLYLQWIKKATKQSYGSADLVFLTPSIKRHHEELQNELAEQERTFTFYETVINAISRIKIELIYLAILISNAIFSAITVLAYMNLMGYFKMPNRYSDPFVSLGIIIGAGFLTLMSIYISLKSLMLAKKDMVNAKR